MSHHEETAQDENPTRKPWFVICGVLVALLVAVALVLMLLPSGDDRQASEATATTAPSTAPSAAPAGDESICGLDATGGATLTKAPKDLTWKPIRSLYLPSSKTHGPGVVDETSQVRSCFARTPEGALLAATSMLGASADPDVLVASIKDRGVDSPGKTVALGKAQQRASSGDSTVPPMEVAGFRVLSFTKDAATVEVVFAIDTGSEKVYQTMGADMVWQDGDWKFVFADDGSGGPTGARVSDLSNYVKWSRNG